MKCIGAIVGDIVGSVYEFQMCRISPDFPLFSKTSRVTDDSVLTLAVMEGLAGSVGFTAAQTKLAVVDSMQKAVRAHPAAGYGKRFSKWADNPVPYGSYGNGSAMRVSPVAWMCDNLLDVLNYALLVSEVSHDHMEGIKGAQAVASAIYFTRQGIAKADLKDWLQQTFGYRFDRTLDEIRQTYWKLKAVSCQQTVPEALTAYFEGESFEDVVRKAVSLKGDTDTVAAIAASVAEAAYPVPAEIESKALSLLDAGQLEILSNFQQCVYGGAWGLQGEGGRPL